MENKIKELEEKLLRKKQECEKAKQNAQDTYDLWQALIESFNILQGEKIKLEQECEELKLKIIELNAMNETLKNECDNCEHLVQLQQQRIAYQIKAEDYKLFNESLEAKNEKLDTENKRLVAELANPVFDSFEELDNLKQTLAEIKEIAQYDVYTPHTDLCIKLNWVKKKISECEVDNE